MVRTAAVTALVLLSFGCAAPEMGDEPLHATHAADTKRIAASDERITLARRIVDGKVHTLGVRTLDPTTIEAVDLSAHFDEFPTYPLDLPTAHGFDEVAAAMAAGTASKVAIAELAPPIAETDAQIATGLNFPEHQEEAGGETTPFLFPKIAMPTKSVSTVERQADDLLDYEIEMCVAFGGPIAKAADVDHQLYGFTACNDVSNRVPQVTEADALRPELAKGFTDAKSRPGFLPLGPVVVVPKVGKTFASERTLWLAVNGAERQHDKGTSMIWSIEEVVQHALEIGEEARFPFGDRAIALLPTGRIEKGQLLVMGTPGGVVFRVPTKEFKAKKAAEYLAKGGPIGTHTDPVTYVKDQYVEELRADGGFLEPGDIVDCSIDLLGAIQIRISGVR